MQFLTIKFEFLMSLVEYFPVRCLRLDLRLLQYCLPAAANIMEIYLKNNFFIMQLLDGLHSEINC
jgi:hypothetical protein